ncbi:hypothetical protein [Diaphorobacter ruginosibacter]|uniref:hypothetical protein n=1 Tax=Diaphorobacter ruginosibacter TaxID=1715720 RepID=UPI00333F4016
MADSPAMLEVCIAWREAWITAFFALPHDQMITIRHRGFSNDEFIMDVSAGQTSLATPAVLSIVMACRIRY